MFFDASDIAEDRADFAELLTDTCRITRKGVAETQFNEDTGQNVQPARTIIYEGPCRLQVKVDINSNVVETTAGDREWTYLTSQLQLPTEGTGEVDVDDVCEILTAPYDESQVGILLNIAGPYHKSVATYRRFRVREVVA